MQPNQAPHNNTQEVTPSPFPLPFPSQANEYPANLPSDQDLHFNAHFITTCPPYLSYINPPYNQQYSRNPQTSISTDNAQMTPYYSSSSYKIMNIQGPTRFTSASNSNCTYSTPVMFENMLNLQIPSNDSTEEPGIWLSYRQPQIPIPQSSLHYVASPKLRTYHSNTWADFTQSTVLPTQELCNGSYIPPQVQNLGVFMNTLHAIDFTPTESAGSNTQTLSTSYLTAPGNLISKSQGQQLMHLPDRSILTACPLFSDFSPDPIVSSNANTASVLHQGQVLPSIEHHAPSNSHEPPKCSDQRKRVDHSLLRASFLDQSRESEALRRLIDLILASSWYLQGHHEPCKKSQVLNFSHEFEEQEILRTTNLGVEGKSIFTAFLTIQKSKKSKTWACRFSISVIVRSNVKSQADLVIPAIAICVTFQRIIFWTILNEHGQLWLD